MKIKNKFIGIFITICSVIVLCTNVFADNLKDISSQVSKYVDMTSISSDYKVHNATDGDNIKQITFINTKTRQRMSITFSKYMTAKNEEEMTKFVEDLKNNNGTGKSDKITSFKTFEAHGQSTPYFNVNQYDKGKILAKAMIGAIGDYEGKFIIIQSYSFPTNYDEQEAVEFFSKLRLKTNEF